MYLCEYCAGQIQSNEYRKLSSREEYLQNIRKSAYIIHKSCRIHDDVVIGETDTLYLVESNL